MKQGTWQLPVFVAGLTMGTASTLVVKALYQTSGPDYDGIQKPFEKPLFLTFMMFFGMAFAIPLHFLILKFSQSSSSSSSDSSTPSSSSSTQLRESAPLIQNGTNGGGDTPPAVRNIIKKSASSGKLLDTRDPFGDESVSIQSSQNEDSTTTPQAEAIPNDFTTISSLLNWRINMILLIPSLFDLVGSALSTIGLLYCSVSVYQLSRCTVIIVTAVLKALVLRHPLSSNMWAGVVINAIAMILVGSTTLMEDQGASTSETHGDARIGILFILASCLVQGAQYVFEEKVMAFDAVPPLILVGMEGFWGCILFLAFVFPFAAHVPGNDNGRYEDVWESFHMLSNSGPLLALLVAFVLIVFLYNVFCIYITFLLNSIWHAIMDNCRPVAVWACGLTLYYTTGKVGEPWTTASWVELAGMIVLFYGTAIYNGNIIFPGMSTKVDLTEEEEPEDEIPVLRDPLPSTPRLAALAPKGSTPRSLDAVQLLTQSPRLRPGSPLLSHHHHHSHGPSSLSVSHDTFQHGHNHSHGSAKYGSV